MAEAAGVDPSRAYEVKKEDSDKGRLPERGRPFIGPCVPPERHASGDTRPATHSGEGVVLPGRAHTPAHGGSIPPPATTEGRAADTPTQAAQSEPGGQREEPFPAPGASVTFHATLCPDDLSLSEVLQVPQDTQEGRPLRGTVITRRTWRERLLTRPWRPWHDLVCVSFTGTPSRLADDDEAFTLTVEGDMSQETHRGPRHWRRRMHPTLADRILVPPIRAATWCVRRLTRLAERLSQ